MKQASSTTIQKQFRRTFSISDKLYFEPLIIEDVMHVIDLEKPGKGSSSSLADRQQSILADGLVERGVKILVLHLKTWIGRKIAINLKKHLRI